MSSFILRLSIISVLGLMVQSAPINLTERSASKTMIERKLFDLSKALYNAVGKLLSANYNLPDLPKVDIDNKTRDIAWSLYNIFSDQCKNYTIAITLKHQLQDHLFNTETNLDLSSENATYLSIILTSLQTMANTFKNKEDNRTCIQLAPAQYKIMYHVQYSSGTPLLQLLYREFGRFYPGV